MTALAASDDSAYLLSSEYKILEVNAGFRRFARENGGTESIERWRHESVLAAVSGPLRAFFAAAFERVRRVGQPWMHAYACNSAERVRNFGMTVYPLGDQLVVVHALRFEGPHTELACAPDVRSYVREGTIMMCSHCRRVRNVSGEKRWDWVPAYLLCAPAAVSHGLCEPCAQFYWP
jgi:hypothetical protein